MALAKLTVPAAPFLGGGLHAAAWRWDPITPSIMKGFVLYRWAKAKFHELAGPASARNRIFARLMGRPVV